MDAPRARPREDALDVLRAGAILLVVAVHAALPYIRRPIPGLAWAVADPSGTSPLFDLFCWGAMSLSNPLFFLIAGYLGAGLWESRGPAGFWANRARRVLIPFVAALIVIGPLTLGSWCLGWVTMGRISWHEVARFRFQDAVFRGNLHGPGNLWFLYDLILMMAAWTGLRTLGLPWDRVERALGRLADGVPGLGLLAAASATFLWIHLRARGIDAALDRHNTFLPDPSRVAHFFLFFLVGTGLRRVPGGLARLWPRAGWMLAASLPVFAARAFLLGRDWDTPLDATGRAGLCALGGLLSWLLVLGSLGSAVRWIRSPKGWVRYLADASFWITLSHMPLVALIQVGLYGMPVHPAWKFSISLAVPMVLCLASYQVMVRHGAIGRLLHGPKPRPDAGLFLAFARDRKVDALVLQLRFNPWDALGSYSGTAAPRPGACAATPTSPANAPPLARSARPAE
ncbi:MAG: acyltransferase family protein [Isosphaeraceae bacterium]